MTGELYGAPPCHCDDQTSPCKRPGRPTLAERGWQLAEIWRSAKWAADVRDDPPDGVTPAVTPAGQP